MRLPIERRLSALEQRGGAARPVVWIRDGETPESARERHLREYPAARGRTLAVIPLPCATAEEWAARHAPEAVT